MVFAAGIDPSASEDGRISIERNGTQVASNWMNGFYASTSSPPLLVSTGDTFRVEVNISASTINASTETFFGGYVVNPQISNASVQDSAGTISTRLSSVKFLGNLDVRDSSGVTVVDIFDDGLDSIQVQGIIDSSTNMSQVEFESDFTLVTSDFVTGSKIFISISDSDRTVTFGDSSANGLNSVTFIQNGAGQIIFASSGSRVLNFRDSADRTAGQNAIATIIPSLLDSTQAWLGGDVTTAA